MVPEWWLSLMHVSVIGNTGVGKSALCNYLSGKPYQCKLIFVCLALRAFSQLVKAYTKVKTMKEQRQTAKKFEAFASIFPSVKGY